jgi:hypothetical protein
LAANWSLHLNEQIAAEDEFDLTDVDGSLHHCESAAGALALGLCLAEAGRPLTHPPVVVSARWAPDRGFLPVDNLEKKLHAADAFECAYVYVADTQGIPEERPASLAIKRLPSSPHAGKLDIVTALRALRVEAGEPPRLADGIEACIAYANEIPGKSTREKYMVETSGLSAVLGQRLREDKRIPDPLKGCETLVLIPSSSSVAMLLIRALEPQTVIAFCTARTKQDQLRCLLEEAGTGVKIQVHRIDGLGSDQLHRMACDVLETHPTGSLVDVTGGTSTMSAVLAVAAHAKGAPLLYVDTDKQEDGASPQIGSERLVPLLQSAPADTSARP